MVFCIPQGQLWQRLRLYLGTFWEAAVVFRQAKGSISLVSVWVVLLGNIAIRAGKKLIWDGPNMKVTNVPEANEYLHRQYRRGWTL